MNDIEMLYPFVAKVICELEDEKVSFNIENPMAHLQIFRDIKQKQLKRI